MQGDRAAPRVQTFKSATYRPNSVALTEAIGGAKLTNRERRHSRAGMRKHKLVSILALALFAATPQGAAEAEPARLNPDGSIEVVFDREMNLAYLGEKSVKDAADTMKKEIDAALKKPL